MRFAYRFAYRYLPFAGCSLLVDRSLAAGKANHFNARASAEFPCGRSLEKWRQQARGSHDGFMIGERKGDELAII